MGGQKAGEIVDGENYTPSTLVLRAVRETPPTQHC